MNPLNDTGDAGVLIVHAYSIEEELRSLFSLAGTKPDRYTLSQNDVTLSQNDVADLVKGCEQVDRPSVKAAGTARVLATRDGDERPGPARTAQAHKARIEPVTHTAPLARVPHGGQPS